MLLVRLAALSPALHSPIAAAKPYGSTPRIIVVPHSEKRGRRRSFAVRPNGTNFISRYGAFKRAPIADGSPAVGNRRRCLAWRAGRGRIVVFRVALRATRAREHDLLTTAQGDTLEQRTDRY